MANQELKIKDKKKANFKFVIRNFLFVIIFILITIVGFFGVAGKVNAQAEPLGTCLMKAPDGTEIPWAKKLDSECYTGNLSMGGGTRVSWTAYPADTDTTVGYCTASDGTVTRVIKINCTGTWSPSVSTPKASASEFEKWATGESCGVIGEGSMEGCLKSFFYYGLYIPSTFILFVAAKFFNALIAISLNSTLFSKSTFIPTAWAAVRDLSNIFFILILLYIAIKVILDIGASEAKKTIVKVIIIALLINFSMFFTQVVIDSSNILALVFYNKLEVKYKDPVTGSMVDRPDNPSAAGEKDLSGTIYYRFDPTKTLNQEFFEQARKTTLNDKSFRLPQVPTGIIIGIVLLASAMMLFAAYAFFISGIAFVARMIELWVLIIFSPFAFMSSTVPLFSGIEYLGWDAWFKRLLKVSFMAPIFMFFMYLIFLLLQPPGIFGNMITNQGMVQTILLMIIPGMIILILLLKATEFAKKGSGAIGEMVFKGAQIVGGLALGAATGGASMALQGSVGRGAANLAESNKMREWAAKSKLGAATLRMTSGIASSSFDARAVKIGGKTLAGATGMKLGEAQKGGFAEARAARVKRDTKFVDDFIDTSDKGKAELTRGKMDTQRAAEIETQLIRGGMSRANAATHRASLVGNGINIRDLSEVVRHLDAAKREVYADRLDTRTSPTVFGDFFGRAERINARNRIVANKIRKDAIGIKKQQDMAAAMAAWAAAGGATRTEGSGTATSGGGAAAGGGTKP